MLRLTDEKYWIIKRVYNQEIDKKRKKVKESIEKYEINNES